MATLQQLDMNILLWIQEHLRVDALTPFWRAVTFLGNGGWFWIVLCVLLICFGKTRKTGVTAALSLLSGFLITNLLIKNAVARPRPFDTYTQIIPLITRPKDYSFPSGHTCASFAVALVCLRMLPGKWGILPVVLAGMIAFNQIVINWAQKTVSPTKAVLIYTLEPVFAGIIGWLVGEKIGLMAAFGGVLVVASVIISSWLPRYIQERKLACKKE